MDRRNFIKRAAVSSVCLTHIDKIGENYQSLNERDFFDFTSVGDSLNTVVPFKFYPNRKEQIYKQLIELRNHYGLRRFLLVAPFEEIRFSGFPSIDVYHDVGQLLLRLKEDLHVHDIEIGWWCAPSLRSGHSTEFQYITDLSGVINDSSPCPLDPLFMDRFSNNVATVVEIAKPFMVQFEDDYELSNQGPVRFGCFCPLHLQEFAKRQGQFYSREMLMEIFRIVTSESIRLRRAWADLSRDSLVSLAHRIREKVDMVEPSTRISLCQAGVSDLDGDFTEAVARAFAGTNKPLVRLYGTSYSSDSPLGLPSDIFHALYSIQHLPDDFECMHESDTYPHTRFFMSAAKIRSLMTTAFSYGFDESLFYLTQYLDNLIEELGYAKMYRVQAPRFSAIKEAVKGCRVVGCEVVHKPGAHVVIPYKGGRPAIANNAWISITGRYGIPHTAKNGKVKMLAGKIVESMDSEEIKQLLSGPVFLDGVAALSLFKMGWGDFLGAEVEVLDQNIHTCYEGLRDKSLYSNIHGDLQYNWIYAPAGSEGGSFFKLKPSEAAQIVADFLDINEQPVLPSLIQYENKLGGRIAINAFDLTGNNSSTTFNYKKKEIIRQTIEWLGDEHLPVFVRNQPNVFCVCNCADDNTYLIVTVISLCSDPTEDFSLDFASEWLDSKITYLDAKGSWRDLKKELNDRTVKVRLPLILMDPVVLKVSK